MARVTMSFFQPPVQRTLNLIDLTDDEGTVLRVALRMYQETLAFRPYYRQLAFKMWREMMDSVHEERE